MLIHNLQIGVLNIPPPILSRRALRDCQRLSPRQSEPLRCLSDLIPRIREPTAPCLALPLRAVAKECCENQGHEFPISLGPAQINMLMLLAHANFTPLIASWHPLKRGVSSKVTSLTTSYQWSVCATSLQLQLTHECFSFFETCRET